MAFREQIQEIAPPKAKLDPFRRAVVRGLGILLPPLLTIVIFLWVGNTVTNYLLEPLEDLAQWGLVEKVADIRSLSDMPEANEQGIAFFEGETYNQVGDKFIPSNVHSYVLHRLGNNTMPDTAKGVYERYVSQKWLPRQYVIPIFLCIFVLALYLLGKFLAAGVGRFFWTRFERIIHRVPLVRNVYSSVKQVTDFMFTEPDIEYTRVVAVEYPRKGIWSLGMVTGESMLDIQSAANEPVISVLVPTSPMPFTGFTVTVKKSESVDLDITIDQAFQFIVSCGVVVPPQQLAEGLAAHESGKHENGNTNDVNVGRPTTVALSAPSDGHG